MFPISVDLLSLTDSTPEKSEEGKTLEATA
jgi:hypothetical protein